MIKAFYAYVEDFITGRASPGHILAPLLGIIVAPIGFIGGFIKGLVAQVDVAKDALNLDNNKGYLSNNLKKKYLSLIKNKNL